MALATAKYKVKSGRVDAIKLTEENKDDVADWVNGRAQAQESPMLTNDPSTSNVTPVEVVLIPTIDRGVLVARMGQWVYKIPTKGMYVADEAAFLAEYEPVAV